MGVRTFDYVYEVELKVEAAIWNEYRKWLMEHRRQVMEVARFTGSEQWENPQLGSILVRYFAASLEQIESYFSTSAPRFRQEAVDRFGTQFQAQRRVLQFVAT